MYKVFQKYHHHYFITLMALSFSAVMTSLVVINTNSTISEVAAHSQYPMLQISSKWGQMQDPDIAMNSSGRTVIAWSDIGSHSYELMYQIFDENNSPVGLTKRMNQFMPYDQTNPEIAMKDNGDFIGVWQSINQDGEGSAIIGRSFTNGGLTPQKEIKFNQYNRDNQLSPSVDMNENGDVIVAWVSEEQDNTPKSIYAQMYKFNGEKIGREFKVNTTYRSIQDKPSVAIDDFGNFMIVWQSRENDNWNVRGRIFRNDGTPTSDEDFLLHDITEYDQTNPKITRIGSSKFIVIWENVTLHEILELPMENIEGQGFSSTGQKSGRAFKVTEPIFGHQDNPDIAQSTKSRAYITWQNYRQNREDKVYYWDIMGREINITGSMAREENIINKGEEVWNTSPVVAADMNGDVRVMWMKLNFDNYKKTLNLLNKIEVNYL